MLNFKPMLAATAPTLEHVQLPCYASPKLNGFRGIILDDGRLRSRNGKPFDNLYTQKTWSRVKLNGMDGEFILGDSTDPASLRKTNSAMSTIAGEPELTFHVFDLVVPSVAFELRLEHLTKRVATLKDERVKLVPQVLITTFAALERFEEEMVTAGYEGICARVPGSGYKFGRSTLGQSWLVKLKRFTDAEAEVLEVIEKMHNTNEAKKDELGRAKRSSHKAGQVPAGTMGALRVRDLETGIEFNIGIGFDDTDRMFFWEHRHAFNRGNSIVKYKSLTVGVKDKPLSGVYIDLRQPWDI